MAGERHASARQRSARAGASTARSPSASRHARTTVAKLLLLFDKLEMLRVVEVFFRGRATYFLLTDFSTACEQTI